MADTGRDLIWIGELVFSGQGLLKPRETRAHAKHALARNEGERQTLENIWTEFADWNRVGTLIGKVKFLFFGTDPKCPGLFDRRNKSMVDNGQHWTSAKNMWTSALMHPLLLMTARGAQS